MILEVADGLNVEAIRLPENGVWRIGPATDPYVVGTPLSPQDLNSPRAGHRFDSPLATYGVLYFASGLDGCFGETLARYRPDLALVAKIREDWAARGFMEPAAIPADWRHRRLAVRACCADDTTAFLDVESVVTRSTLAQLLASSLSAIGVSELDVPTIRGGDRRVTRLISFWAWEQMNAADDPLFGGVRYLSRLGTEWECWAIFDRVPTRELERRSITIEMPELVRVAKLWGLRAF